MIPALAIAAVCIWYGTLYLIMTAAGMTPVMAVIALAVLTVLSR